MNLHNIKLITKREFLEIVRTKAFKIMTLITPFLIVAWSTLPSMMMMRKAHHERSIVIASSDAGVAQAISDQLQHPPKKEEPKQPRPGQRDESPSDVTYHITVSNDVSEHNRQGLQKQIDARQIDGFLWLDDAGLKARNIS